MEGLQTRTKNIDFKAISSSFNPSSSSRLKQYSNFMTKDFSGSLRDSKLKESFEEIYQKEMSLIWTNHIVLNRPNKFISSNKIPQLQNAQNGNSNSKILTPASTASNFDAELLNMSKTANNFSKGVRKQGGRKNKLYKNNMTSTNYHIKSSNESEIGQLQIQSNLQMKSGNK